MVVPTGITKPAVGDAFRIDIGQLLSSDVLMGLKLDLNRPFGNGSDDNSNYVVDEFNAGEDGGATLAYRQAYARTLYVLMMALVDQVDPAKQWVPYWDPRIANPVSAPVTNDDKAKARARAIAQWAVNVVDYRDSDSIMTPFEFDVYPFAANNAWNPGQLIDTWDVDNDISTDDDGLPTIYRGVVWGCERPELLITETLAFHDKGTVDTKLDSSGQFSTQHDPPGTDPHFDQRFLPKGSLFVEIYNPQSPSDASPPEFYRNSGGNTGGVVLTNTTTSGNPVWRLRIATRENSVTDPTKFQYLDPEEPDPADRGTSAIKTDRIVYFIPDNGNLPETGTSYVTYYPSESQTVSVAPRNYAVIGPASEERDGSGNTIINGVTQIGHLTQAGATATAPARRIELNPAATAPAAFSVYGDGTTEEVQARATAGEINAPAVLRIDQPRRLSVSEPVAGYGTSPPTWSPDYKEYIFDPPQDLPLDYDPAKQTEDDIIPTIFAQEKTHKGYRYVHLQRLADPLRDYDSAANPYITIDTAPVDLSVLNGENNSSNTYEFFARQRGEKGFGLWPCVPPLTTEPPLNDPAYTTTGNVANHAFAGQFCHSLGYLNHCFGDPLNPSQYGVPNAYRGAPGNASGTTFNPAPFAWLTWLNRPFANPLELLQVPCVRSSQLTMSFEMSSASARQYVVGREPFSHLLGFFGAIQPTPDDSLPTDEPGKMLQYRTLDGKLPHAFAPDKITVPHFYRILDYVNVPSRFVDSQTRGNPAQMDIAGEIHAFHSPFNFIPTWREPGRMNINTIADDTMRTALGGDHLAQMPSWADFLAARRRYAVTGNNYFGLDSASLPLPTRIANPYRSFVGADLVPAVPGLDPAAPDPPYLSALIQQGVNATLLRAPFVPGATLDQQAPLFADPALMSTQFHNDSRNSAFFQYQSLQRLSNLTTTRSNVYAVWITVGYFEVEQVAGFNPITQSHIYPEGYTLGQELGIDTGDVTRHRAFYVIDRSIPVGFIPGEDLNTENAVLLKRFIE